MKIKYQIDLNDFFVFSNYLIKTSPLLRKTIRRGQMWWACGPLVGGLVFSILKGSPSEQALLNLSILSIAISLPMYFLYPHYFKYRNNKQINKLYANNNYMEVLGGHEMKISDRHLTEVTEHNESEIQWGSVSKIETVADYTFIFTSDVSAYIVPHQKITEGNVFQFIETLNEAFIKFR